MKTTWTLGKIIFPITVLVVILQHTPVLPWIIELIAPIMGIFGLSGEAAIPLVLGNALNLYAGIAGILSLELTVKEVFIIAVMLSFSHNLFIESGVAVKVGVKLWVILVVRLGLAALSGILINLLWKGGGEIAQYGMAPKNEIIPDGWLEIGLLGLQKAIFRRSAARTHRHSADDCRSIFKGSTIFTEVFGEAGAFDKSDWCPTECFDDVGLRSNNRLGVWSGHYDPSCSGRRGQ